MIKLITGRTSEYQESELVQFCKAQTLLDWINSHDDHIQLDTETNIIKGLSGWKGYLKGKGKVFTPYIIDGERVPEDRKCYTIQIGSKDKRVQYIVDMVGLPFEEEMIIMEVLKCKNPKIIHNALFDYTVILWCYGIAMTNLKDTYLRSALVVCGFKPGEDLAKGYNSYAGCVKRYLNIELDKGEQTSFDGAPMTMSQLEYAAADVVFLYDIFEALEREVKYWGLENAVILEDEVVRPYGNSMIWNMYLDTDMWKALMETKKVEVKEVTKDFHEILLKYFKADIITLGMYSEDDIYEFGWGSSAKKRTYLSLVYDNLVCPMRISDLKKEVKIREHKGEDVSLLSAVAERRFDDATEMLKVYRQDLIDLNVLIPKNTVTINLNSNLQLLSIFQLIDTEIESVGKAVISKIDHPMASYLRRYNRSAKLLSSYGQNFLNAMSPDGMFRVASITQILATGRSSMEHLQLLPGVNEYRVPFNPNNPKTGLGPDGKKWVVVAADYASQEAIVAATFGKEQALLDAVQNGQDFHSTCASLMFKEEWAALGGDPKPKGKPKNKKLLELRGSSKSTSFGLFYGKTAIGLGDDLGVPATSKELVILHQDEADSYILDNSDDYDTYVSEYHKKRKSNTSVHNYLKREHKEGRFLDDIQTADDLIDLFYSTFPNIHQFLVGCADDAVEYKYVRTPGIIGRIRRFKLPEDSTEENSIRRKGQNSPIQGASADMTKLAIVRLNKHLEENNLDKRIKFSRFLHDEVVMICHDDIKQECYNLLIEKMEDAAETLLGHNILKAEGGISDAWVK